MDVKCVLLSDFEKVCRICMKFDENLLQISSFQIIDMITACASVQIWENDDLPNQICNVCFLQLQNTINFKQLCENSDNAFRQIIEQNKNNLWNNQNDLDKVKNEENCPIFIKEESDDENITNQNKEDIKKSIQNNIEEIVEVKNEDIPKSNRKRTRKKIISQKFEDESDSNEDTNENRNDENDSDTEKSDLEYQQTHIKDYKCESCPRLFKKVNALGYHMKEAHNAEGTKCDKCSVICYHSLHLQAHEKTHNRCRICYSTFSTRKQLKEHKLTHETSMKCDTCQEIFQTNRDLEKHIRKMHPKKKPTEEKINYRQQDTNCETCGKSVRKRNLSRHMLTHSENANCEICGKSIRRRNLILHMKTHNENAESLNLKPNVNCDVCGKTVRRYYLRAHMLTHRELNNLNCRYCIKTFKTPEELTNHVEASHKKSICDHCGVKFRSNQLKKHLLTHSSARPYACDKCDKTYRTKWKLKDHVSRIHLNERNFVCTFCSQAFFDKNILTNHVRRHTGEKPFQCDVCEKAFIQKSALNVHMKMHTNFI